MSLGLRGKQRGHVVLYTKRDVRRGQSAEGGMETENEGGRKNRSGKTVKPHECAATQDPSLGGQQEGGGKGQRPMQFRGRSGRQSITTKEIGGEKKEGTRSECRIKLGINGRVRNRTLGRREV